MKKSLRGFTFIELLVVITIISVLVATGMVIFTNAGRKSRDAKRKADLEAIRQALVLYRSDNGCYPDNLNMDTGSPLVDQNYISQPFPKDPKSPDRSYTYNTSTSSNKTCKDGSTGLSSFALEATLESDGSTYVLNSP